MVNYEGLPDLPSSRRRNGDEWNPHHLMGFVWYYRARVMRAIVEASPVITSTLLHEPDLADL